MQLAPSVLVAAGVSWLDTTVNNGLTYYYAVSALNAGGESSPGPATAGLPSSAAP